MAHCFLAVDDERLALADLTNALSQADSAADIRAYTSPTAALEAVRSGEIVPNVAFLDIQMRGWTGLQLAAELRKVLPALEVVFVTAYSEYALESYALHARGYLLKPVSVRAVRAELDVIFPPVLPKDSEKILQVNCFGNFDVFCKGKPVKFSRTKSKELFAYLIYRFGATCSIKEIAAVIFEDKEYDIALKNQMETFKSDLIKSLRAVGCEDVIIKGRNCISIDKQRIDCDYYRFLEGNTGAANSFTGEFMTQYSWAEATAAVLTQKLF